MCVAETRMLRRSRERKTGGKGCVDEMRENRSRRFLGMLRGEAGTRRR